VIVGRTNMPEFGHKAVTDNALIGPTRMPLNLEYNAGGSSGGSAAAVAAQLVAAAQGGDGGGSIRIPASMTGIYGLKPSWGRVPSGDRPNGYGFMHPMISHGPLTRTVRDAALMLDVLAGSHHRDILCLPGQPASYSRAVEEQLRPARVAFCADFGGFRVDQDVVGVLEATAAQLAQAGHEVEEIAIDWGTAPEELAEVWMQDVGVNYAALLRVLRMEGFDLEREPGEMSPSFWRYATAIQRLDVVTLRLNELKKTRVYDELDRLLSRFDFVVGPVVGVAGVRNASQPGETIGPTRAGGVSVDPLLGWITTFLINFTGHPAASVPAGFTAEGLPVGMHVVGRRFCDADVLQLSATLEELKPWRAEHDRRLALSDLGA